MRFVSEIKRNSFLIYFVFRSTCSIFAPILDKFVCVSIEKL
jgi:hypothetical protein